mgnify:CR=1 FL=1
MKPGAEAVAKVGGTESKSNNNYYLVSMQFGKRSFFLALNGIAVLVLLLYFVFWQMGSVTTGKIMPPLQASMVQVQYNIDGKSYTESFMRHDIPLRQRIVVVRYQAWNPSLSRIQSFMGIGAEPLAWWLVFLLASAMLLLTNNSVFSKGTRFRLQKRFPWLLMDEFFPAAGPYRHNDAPRPKEAKKLPDGWR